MRLDLRYLVVVHICFLSLASSVRAQQCLELIKSAETEIQRNCADCVSGTQIALQQAVERLESMLTLESASTESLDVLTFGYRNLAYGYEPRTAALLSKYEERLRDLSDERVRRTPTDPKALAEAARVAEPELRLQYSIKAYRFARREAAWAARSVANHLLARENLDEEELGQVLVLLTEAYEMGDEAVRKNLRIELKDVKLMYPEKIAQIDEILDGPP